MKAMGTNWWRRIPGKTILTVLVRVAVVFSAPPPIWAATDIVAAIQVAPRNESPASERERITDLIRAAANRGATFVVLPGYSLSSDAEPLPGPTTLYFGSIAAKLGISLVVTVKELLAETGTHFVTTALLSQRGEVAYTHRKVLLTPREQADKRIQAGHPRTLIFTLDEGGRRIGIVSGHDIQVGVPQLANRGANLILVSADWRGEKEIDWIQECQKLAREYKVNLVIANVAVKSGADAAPKAPLTTIIANDGSVLARADHRDDVQIIDATIAESAFQIMPHPLGLPSVPIPSNEPFTPQVVALGRKLFFDKNLSSTKTIACASCHNPAYAYSSGSARGTGIDGNLTIRNVPTLLNVAYRPLLQWDGYASSLESQAKYPISNVREMNFHYLDKAVPYLRSQPEYQAEFRASLNTDNLTWNDVATALAAYERTLLSGNSPFDRFFYGRDADAMNPAMKRGFELFRGKAGCVQCHSVGSDSALFMDFKFHNVGAGFDVASQTFDDLGVGKVSFDDRSGLFFTPTLRNIARTAPYMHDGKLATLDDVIEFFDKGGIPNPSLDPTLRPLHLSAQEKRDLKEFLNALNGDDGFLSHPE